jgi:hypothetical protein
VLCNCTVLSLWYITSTALCCLQHVHEHMLLHHCICAARATQYLALVTLTNCCACACFHAALVPYVSMILIAESARPSAHKLNLKRTHSSRKKCEVVSSTVQSAAQRQHRCVSLQANMCLKPCRCRQPLRPPIHTAIHTGAEARVLP